MQKEKIYLVGGAVRDNLLGIPVNEKDWVVVGGSAQDLISMGFEQVGVDFPVFLHPETKDQYALARTEIKRGLGHKGFSVNAEKSITIDQDLKRRDLTINAMAQDSDGNIIDPWRGQEDIQSKMLRHVSSAFSEDPLRILRTARFKAKFSNLGFVVAPETLKLMRDMVAAGELSYLHPNRIWREIEEALITRSPEAFFATLDECGALTTIFPELEDTPPKKIRLLLKTLRKSAELSTDTRVRFAVLVYQLTSFFDDSEDKCQKIFARLKVPKRYKTFIVQVRRLALDYLALMRLNENELALLLKDLDSLRRKNSLHPIALSCEAVFFRFIKNSRRTRIKYLMAAKDEFSKPEIKTKSSPTLTGKDYGSALFRRRTARLNTWINSEGKLIREF